LYDVHIHVGDTLFYYVLLSICMMHIFRIGDNLFMMYFILYEAHIVAERVRAWPSVAERGRGACLTVVERG
jgi:hypothetical protein